jgi:hypothetical protein
MEIATEKVTKITLVLDLYEARWLRGLVQNPQCEPNKEDPDNKQMREVFFTALSEFLDY